MIRRLLAKLFPRPRTRVDVTRVTTRVEIQQVQRDYDWIDRELRAMKRR